MTAFFDPKTSPRRDDLPSAGSRQRPRDDFSSSPVSREERAPDPRREARRVEERSNGRSNGSASSEQPNLREFREAVGALKAELERSGHPDRFVMEKVAQIAQFAETTSTLATNGSAAAVVARRIDPSLARAIRNADTPSEAAEAAAHQIQSSLQCDRVVILKFEDDRQGAVLAEATGYGWTSARQATLTTALFGLERADEFLDRPVVALPDSDELPSYQRALLDRYQVRASLAVPILAGRTVWGVVAAQQCAAPRDWQAEDADLLDRAALELSLVFSGSEGSASSPALERLEQVIDTANGLEDLLRRLCQELRSLLGVDRATIFRFNADGSGDFIAEAVDRGWSPLLGQNFRDTYFAENLQGGRYGNAVRDAQPQVFVCNDLTQSNLQTCYVQMVERLQVRSYIIVPLVLGGGGSLAEQNRLWGLLAVYQNASARDWTSSETDLMRAISDRASQAIGQTEAIDKLQKQVARQRSISVIVDKIHQFLDLDAIMQITNDELRVLMSVDRAAVYRFNEDWSGDFVSESLERGRWTPLLNKSFRDTYFERTQGGRYIKGESLAVADIFTEDYDPCHLKLLEKFECRAYIIVPVLANEKLWGLLAVYQNDRVRFWEPEEVDLVEQMGLQMGIAVQQSESLRQLKDRNRQIEQSYAQDRAIVAIVNQVRQTLDLEVAFDITTRELRQLLSADRVGIYAFDEDWGGKFIAESVSSGWRPLLTGDPRSNRAGAIGGETLQRLRDNGYVVADTHLKDRQGGIYREGQSLVVNDVAKKGYSACYLNVLEQLQVRAYIHVPIFKGTELWGLLAVHQNGASRAWNETELQTTQRVASQLGVAIQQAEYIDQLNAQQRQLERVATRERAISALVTKLRQSLDIESIFNVTTRELRPLLVSDRVGIYAFNQDWSGQFMAESVASGWRPLLEVDSKTFGLQEVSSACNAFQRLRDRGYVVADTYLQDNKGGAYREGQYFRVDDVYAQGYPQCYLSVLEQMQAKAYLHVPIFKGSDLWGLLAIYQNDGPRHWDDLDVQTALRVAEQLGVAIQQAEILEELRRSSIALEEASQRDKAAKESLQQKALALLLAVRPALEGDLTVRAPITEDEVGTIADAYNNTLQSMREIVEQLQVAADKVSGTSQSSSSAIAELATQAQNQYRALTAAVEQIQGMASATAAVTDNAQQVSAAVHQANETVQAGDKAMNQTVEAILAIRDTVAETGRKIRSLSDSSQKISKIVSLIGNFTTQTQLLALNAAIEATRAGEYGRGFTVVADEVRSLARQSADATTEIESLVEEIQAETSAVAEAMEAGIQQVMEGTNLVSATRSSLSAIVQVTGQIGELVEGIASAANQQTNQASSVTATMNDVAAIADRTSSDSVALAASLQELLAVAKQLQSSVGRFKVN